MSTKPVWSKSNWETLSFENESIDIQSLDELGAHLIELYAAHSFKMKSEVLCRLQNVYPVTTSYQVAGKHIIKKIEQLTRKRVYTRLMKETQKISEVDQYHYVAPSAQEMT